MAILARVLGLKLAHVESGLRSFRWLDPFPEEIVRVLVNRRADLLFAPGQWAVDNLERMKAPGRVVRLPANTVKDALDYTLDVASRRGDAPPAQAPYALVSIHRFETVNSRSAMRRVVDIVVRAAKGLKMIWPLHTVTRRALVKADLLGVVEEAGVDLSDTLPYDRFAPLLSQAEFVIADMVDQRNGDLPQYLHLTGQVTVVDHRPVEPVQPATQPVQVVADGAHQWLGGAAAERAPVELAAGETAKRDQLAGGFDQPVALQIAKGQQPVGGVDLLPVVRGQGGESRGNEPNVATQHPKAQRPVAQRGGQSQQATSRRQIHLGHRCSRAAGGLGEGSGFAGVGRHRHPWTPLSVMAAMTEGNRPGSVCGRNRAPVYWFM